MTARDHEREETFARLYQSGQTLQQIANQHAVTRQYVHAVLKRAGIPGRPTGRRFVGDDTVMSAVALPFVRSAEDAARIAGCAASTIRLTLNRLGKRQAVTRLFRLRKHSSKRVKALT